MKSINTDLLSQTIFLRNTKILPKLLAQMIRHHRLGEIGLSKLTSNSVLNLAIQLNSKTTTLTQDFSQISKPEEFWISGEQKIFVWFIICFCHGNDLDVSQIAQKEFQNIYSLFPLKEKLFLRYQFYYIFNKDVRHKWTEEEVRILKNIIEPETLQNTWKKYSYLLFVKSNGQYYESPEACRDRWQNHLDPNILKKKWTAQEDIKLMKLVQHYGLCWSKISKKLSEARTQHMVKNRFHSIMKKKGIAKKHIVKQQVIAQVLCSLQKELSILEPLQNMNHFFCQQTVSSFSSQDQIKEENFQDGIKCQQMSEQKSDQGFHSKLIGFEEEQYLFESLHQQNQDQRVQYISMDQIINQINIKSYGNSYCYIRALKDDWMSLIEEDRLTDQLFF